MVTTPSPHHQNRGGQTVVQINECNTPSGTEKKLQEMCGTIGGNNALGFDRIANRALKFAVKIKPELFATTLETYLRE